MKKNTTTTEAGQSWVSTASMPDEFVYTNAEQVLSQPTFVVSSTDSSQLWHLYTKEQMFEMFRLGYKARRIGAYGILRKLNVGEKTYLPYEAWNSARTAANQLKKEFGSQFRVKKIGLYGGNGQIEVIRDI